LYGATGVEFIAQLLDFDPSGRIVDPPAIDEAVPSPGSTALLGQAAVHALQLPVVAGRFAVRTARTVGSNAVGIGRRVVTGSGLGMSRPRRTPLNGTLSPRREAAFTRVPLDQLKRVKETFGGTVNDVVLAATAQALREYFLDRDGLPTNQPTASCPVSAGGSTVEGTDRLTALLVTLPIDVADPVEQLQLISASTLDAKGFTDAVGMDTVAGLADAMPPPMLNVGASVYTALKIARLHPPMASLVVSNMVGPPIPLYLAGARIESIYPLGPLLPEIGLNVTVLSDMGMLDVGLLACPEIVPDVGAIADGFVAAASRLHDAAIEAAAAG
jgi:diacylglycerol O-acyltransferase